MDGGCDLWTPRRRRGVPIEASISQLELHDRSSTPSSCAISPSAITQLKALRESEQRFRNMADTAPVMIWVSGVDKRCTYFNQHGSFTGRTIDEELGDGWIENVHPEDYQSCLETYVRLSTCANHSRLNSDFDALTDSSAGF
jgi:PAS domain-containing protein